MYIYYEQLNRLNSISEEAQKLLTGKRHKKPMTFQVYEDQLEALQKIAAETGLSQADILRQFIDQGVEGHEMERVKRRGRGSRA